MYISFSHATCCICCECFFCVIRDVQDPRICSVRTEYRIRDITPSYNKQTYTIYHHITKCIQNEKIPAGGHGRPSPARRRAARPRPGPPAGIFGCSTYFVFFGILVYMCALFVKFRVQYFVLALYVSDCIGMGILHFV